MAAQTTLQTRRIDYVIPHDDDQVIRDTLVRFGGPSSYPIVTEAQDGRELHGPTQLSIWVAVQVMRPKAGAGTGEARVQMALPLVLVVRQLRAWSLDLSRLWFRSAVYTRLVLPDITTQEFPTAPYHVNSVPRIVWLFTGTCHVTTIKANEYSILRAVLLDPKLAGYEVIVTLADYDNNVQIELLDITMVAMRW
ncbi:hypothetical protein CONLIGDRAFT_685930 [Coniochaeta ligniaria NRRL 30616]|uniref:Uncharacterized protein n=1 Tax=Coniochaeta ligniaria NRRL 30616 TaxID=1408157 RepID=A0A1J7I9H6_9PEZI|nr:hypothetical protein CONLIGDRAFT_685930 [Coniochaeta ligniaria NRRL 30616]